MALHQPFSLSALFTISFHFPSLSYFLLHAFYLSVPHSPIWQALSCARVTLASWLPQKVRQGTKKNPPTFHLFFLCVFLSLRPTQTHSYLFNYLLWMCICTLVCAVHWCARSVCVCVCVVFLCKQSLLCVCAHWLSPCRRWHTLTDGAQRGFLLFAEEFAL